MPWLAVDVVVDPLELFAHALRAHARHAEHAQATGLGHLNHHVPTMRERKDGKLYTEHLTHQIFHLHPFLN